MTLKARKPGYYPATGHFEGPPDRSQYRNFWGKFKPRVKVHLVRLSMHGQWVATGLVGPDVGFSALGDTPKEAWSVVAAKQTEWWETFARHRRDIP